MRCTLPTNQFTQYPRLALRTTFVPPGLSSLSSPNNTHSPPSSSLNLPMTPPASAPPNCSSFYTACCPTNCMTSILVYFLKHIEITAPQRLQPDTRAPELFVLLYSMLSNQLDDFLAILARFLERIDITAPQRRLEPNVDGTRHSGAMKGASFRGEFGDSQVLTEHISDLRPTIRQLMLPLRNSHHDC